jgi:adenylosuccinate synthase
MTAKKADKFLDKNPEFAAKQCAERFPIKETIDTLMVTDTALISAYEQEYMRALIMLNDLMNKGCDTIVREKIKEVVKTLPAKTNTKIVVKTQENTAKQQVIIDSCQKMSSLLHKKLDIETQKIKELTDKNEKLSRQRDNLFWLIVLLIISLFRRPLLRIITKTIKPI